MSPEAWVFAGIAFLALGVSGAVVWFANRVMERHLALIAVLNGKGREMVAAVGDRPKEEKKEPVKRPQVI